MIEARSILAVCDGHVVCVPTKPVGSLQALTLAVRLMRVSSATTPSSIACLITGLTQKLLVKGEKQTRTTWSPLSALVWESQPSMPRGRQGTNGLSRLLSQQGEKKNKRK